MEDPIRSALGLRNRKWPAKFHQPDMLYSQFDSVHMGTGECRRPQVKLSSVQAFFFIEYAKDLRIFMIKVKKLVTDNTLQASALG